MVVFVGEARAATCAKGQYRYNYISLDSAKPPDALFADYFKVTDQRRVYGNAYTCGDVFCTSSIIVYERGTTTVLHENANGYTANEAGLIGGSILTDPENGTEQAALFHETKVQIISRLPNELRSRVVKVTDSRIALVESVNATTFATSYYLFKQGVVTPLDFGSHQVRNITVNDAGVLAGTVYDGPVARAFRYRPPYDSLELLDPVQTEPDSWGLGLNKRGDVLGYSFVGGGLERVGYWRNDKFRTSFVEGTPEFPTVSNRLLWNEAGLIVITDDRREGKSYLLPKPGVRLDLADITTGALPAYTFIVDVNERGDLLGSGGPQPFSQDTNFLLRRECVRT